MNDQPQCQHQWLQTKEKQPNGNMLITDACALCPESVSMEVPTVDAAPTGKPVQQPEAPPPPPAPPAPPPAPAAAPAAQAPKGSVVVKAGATGALVPTTIQEAWLFCQRMAMSYTLPPAMYAIPKLPDGMDTGPINIMEVATARAFQALQLGMEAGLPPGQAIQSVLVLNGIGTLWGDAQLALVINSGLCEDFTETTEGEMFSNGQPNKDYAWICTTKRRGDAAPYTVRFTIGDAQRANLWDKKTWKTHPGRLGMYKARAFCLRDKYPDVLKGLCHSTEEMEGEIIDATPSNVTPPNPAEKLSSMLQGDMLQQVAPLPEQVKPAKAYTVDSPPFAETKEATHAEEKK